MWGNSHNEKMIDFFGISPKKFLYYNWNENPDIFSWVTKNGIILPAQQIFEITCGKGLIIMSEEEKYRRRVSPDEYDSIPPKIEGLEFKMEDFSTQAGRIKLLDLVK